MSEVKEKPVKRLFKKIGKVIKPILRGALKSIPILNPIIEITENIRSEVKNQNSGEVKKHNYISITIQIICVIAIIYAFATKQITVDQLLQLLNFNAGDQTISN